MNILFLFSATTFAAVDTKPASVETTAPADLDLVFVLDKSGNIYVTTVLFNHQSSTLHNREPISKVKNLTLEDYSVGGNTALLDAVGQTIEKTRETRKITKNNNVLFVIITDGEENSSQKYSQSKIKSMVNSAEKKISGTLFSRVPILMLFQKPVVSVLKAQMPPVICRIKKAITKPVKL